VSLVVVGSVALDTIESTWGKAEESLGGSATYASLAAAVFTAVSVVGVVGDDFKEEHVKLLAGRGIDTTGLKRKKGATFRWKARYGDDPDKRETICTELNVFEEFRPSLSDAQKAAETIFLANIDPELQLSVLEQAVGRRTAVCDTMAFWMDRKRAELDRLFGMVDGVIINEEELIHYSGEANMFRGYKAVLEKGTGYLVVKKGAAGAVLISEKEVFFAPVYPVREPKDPTGAGDSFAGGFLGYLDSLSRVPDHEDLKKAVVVGSAVASFAVSEFGVGGITSLTREKVRERYDFIRSATVFGEM